MSTLTHQIKIAQIKLEAAGIVRCMAYKTKTLEHCVGSNSPAHEHPVYNSRFNRGRDPLRSCNWCGKLLHTRKGKLRAHGRMLSTLPE